MKTLFTITIALALSACAALQPPPTDPLVRTLIPLYVVSPDEVIAKCDRPVSCVTDVTPERWIRTTPGIVMESGEIPAGYYQSAILVEFQDQAALTQTCGDGACYIGDTIYTTSDLGMADSFGSAVAQAMGLPAGNGILGREAMYLMGYPDLPTGAWRGYVRNDSVTLRVAVEVKQDKDIYAECDNRTACLKQGAIYVIGEPKFAAIDLNVQFLAGAALGDICDESRIYSCYKNDTLYTDPTYRIYDKLNNGNIGDILAEIMGLNLGINRRNQLGHEFQHLLGKLDTRYRPTAMAYRWE